MFKTVLIRLIFHKVLNMEIREKKTGENHIKSETVYVEFCIMTIIIET